MFEDTAGPLFTDISCLLFFLSFPFTRRCFRRLDLRFHSMDCDVSTGKSPAVFIVERVGGNIDGKGILPPTRIATIHYVDRIGVS